MILMGFPNTFVLSDISFITNDPPPTITLFPILMLCIILDPIPIKQYLPILTWPAILTPGAICVPSPIFVS